ncbi:MAG: Xylose isomerase domain protein barrel [Verrucomicrobia bacterium]|nr:Xylose isomerase domain protein barrel [Verrucomicrobiota bacterium]
MSTPALTRTGGFPIAIRLTGDFAKAPTAETAAWVKAQGFGAVDIYADALATIPTWRNSGLEIGTMDLFGPEWQGMLSADAGKRKATAALGVKNIRAAAAAGVKRFFIVMLAEDEKLPRKETFKYMVETYGELRAVLKETNTFLSIEGWPGCNAQCCNPESYRAFLKEMNSAQYGINYDPSHLIRMGIDPARFIDEFAAQVVHVHGKDTYIDPERLYNIGTEQAGVFAEGLPWGGYFWRYTIPGAGAAPWTKLLATLQAAKFKGFVSIELEDVNYNGTLEGERKGFAAARDFLKSV